MNPLLIAFGGLIAVFCIVAVALSVTMAIIVTVVLFVVILIAYLFSRHDDTEYRRVIRYVRG